MMCDGEMSIIELVGSSYVTEHVMMCVQALVSSKSVLVDVSLHGWREIEYEVNTRVMFTHVRSRKQYHLIGGLID